jgi:hypothetical protein
MQARLMGAAPGAEDPVDIGNEFVRLPESKTRLSDAGDPDGLPPAVPALAAGAPTRACITLPVDTDGIRIDPAIPAGVPVAGVTPAAGAVRADLVHIERGKGAVTVVAASPTTPAASGTVSVVTDTGLQYPLASRELLTKLGYGKVTPRQIPAELFALLPAGPSLDPARARQAEGRVTE